MAKPSPKKIDAMYRSINMFLRKKRVLKQDDHILRHGSKVQVFTKAPTPIWGYVVGVTPGARGPNVVVVFSASAHDVDFGYYNHDHCFSYYYYRYWSTNPPPQMSEHSIGWRDIVKVENKNYDYLSMIFEDHPAIREIGKNILRKIQSKMNESQGG